MKPKHKRLFATLLTTIVIATGVALVLYNFNNNIVFFVTPTEAMTQFTPMKTLRIGGVVRKDSLRTLGPKHTFELHDDHTNIKVTYTGLLPDLFKEGSTAVVQGKFLDPALFQSDLVLAKHDENYQPVGSTRSGANQA